MKATPMSILLLPLGGWLVGKIIAILIGQNSGALFDLSRPFPVELIGLVLGLIAGAFIYDRQKRRNEN